MEVKLIGEHVKMCPLVRGENDERGTLMYVIWTAIETADDWGQIFWEMDHPFRGDLYHWINYLNNDKDPAVMLMFTDHNNALAGVIWFNQYNEQDKSAAIHLWVDPGHRGAATREMGLMATDYAFQVLKLNKIVGISPYPIVRNFGLRCGYKEVERGNYDVNGITRTLFRVERMAT